MKSTKQECIDKIKDLDSEIYRLIRDKREYQEILTSILKEEFKAITKEKEEKLNKRKSKYPIKVSDNCELVYREELHKNVVQGVDLGAYTLKVIARKGDTYLVWAGGHTGWSGLGTTSYYGGSMHVIVKGSGDRFVDTHDHITRFKRNYDEGNSIVKSLDVNRESIIEIFGEDISKIYKRGTTVVVYEEI